jgi:tetratricopeptide (TPR) repeat protein
LGTLLELFGILDGIDEENFPAQIRINPDPSIRVARHALSGQASSQKALKDLNEQIKLVRPLMRSIRFDVVENVISEFGWSPKKIFTLASELHLLSALLYAQIEQFESARAHLLRAITCKPDNPNLAFHLVDVYCQEGRFADAFTLLDRTYEAFAPGHPDQLLAMYRLTLDAHASGNIEEARQLYEAISHKPNAGVYGELVQRQLWHIEKGLQAPPANHTLEGYYTCATNSMQTGAHKEALSSFYDVLAWHPTHESSWFFVGEIYMLGLNQEGRFDILADYIPIKIRLDIDDDRRGQLLNAVQALSIASSFGQSPEVVTESHKLLIACYLELAEPAEAVHLALTVTHKEPENPASWVNLSIAYLANMDLSHSAEAVKKALLLNANDSSARHMLAMLEQIVGDR